MSKNNKISGFSLLEFIIVISILSLLLVFSVPSFNSMRHKISVSNYIESLKNMIRQARVMSVSLNSRLFIIPVINDNYTLGLVLVTNIYDKNKYLMKINKAPENIEVSYHGFPSKHEIVFDSRNDFWSSNGSFDIHIRGISKNIIIKINKAGYLH